MVKLSTIINNVKCFAEKYCLFLSGMAAAPKMEITAPSVKLNISYQGVITFQAWVGPKVLDFSAHLILFNETRPRAGLRPAGPRWIVGRKQFSWVHFSCLVSRLRRSARRGQFVLRELYK